jgi:ribosomal peptide maturation radical SAM protein 1
MASNSVSLVSMPWHMLGSPSIQLGTLEAVLARAGVPCRSHSLYLEFQSFLAGRQRDFTIDDYGEICSRWENVGAGDWVFALPGLRTDAESKDERYVALLRAAGMPTPLIRKLGRVRALVPEFLDLCADEVLAGDPAIVGFTSVYSQTWASAALAQRLAARAPHVCVIFGGTSCEGPMGAALLRAFPQVDAVVRGEAEGVLAELALRVIAGEPVPALDGVCRRGVDGELEECGLRAPEPAMEDVPCPRYDEYFERLGRSPLATAILPQLPFESARGCWWGMKAHCTFCGLNGTAMKFRSKSPERVLEEVATLAARHGALDFTAVDNIIDMDYFDTLLPWLAERGHDLSLFYETKANLTEQQVRRFRHAGVRAIQPGIESLSTPTLKLMRKGVTAFQNVRLLKWCTQHGIRVIWNLLYGFPREQPQEYARMADLVPSLVHFPAPSLGELAVYRFSPYHGQPSEHGLELGGPLPFYELLYELEHDQLRDLAQVFEYRHADGRDPREYVAELDERVRSWNRDEGRNRGALTYRRGPGFLVITDTRTTTTNGSGPARYTLEGAEAAVYQACEAGATRRGIGQQLAERDVQVPDERELTALLAELAEARLVYHEEGRYLSLALPIGA